MGEKYSDNRKLVVALRERDLLAYEYIYKKYYNELFLFSRSYMLSEDESHDTIHEIFTTMLENANKINVETDLKGYLYMSIKNSSINKLKHYNITVKNRGAIIESMRFDRQDNKYRKEILEQKMAKLTRNLSQQQQKIIKMKTMGKSYDEIASELNISKLTVSVHIKRAYKYFRENILIFFYIFLIFIVPQMFLLLLY